MWPSDFTPYDSNLRPPNFSLCTVDKSDLLAKIESIRTLDLIETSDGIDQLRSFCVINTFDLNQAAIPISCD